MCNMMHIFGIEGKYHLNLLDKSASFSEAPFELFCAQKNPQKILTCHFSNFYLKDFHSQREHLNLDSRASKWQKPFIFKG